MSTWKGADYLQIRPLSRVRQAGIDAKKEDRKLCRGGCEMENEDGAPCDANIEMKNASIP